MTAPPALLTAVAEATWEATRAARLRPNCCIAACRIAVDALAYFGIGATPEPARVFAINRAGIALLDAGIPTAQWPEQAWSVGVDERAPYERGPNAYAGHLVLHVWHEGEWWLLDPSCGQFARPTRSLPMPGGFVGALDLDAWTGAVAPQSHRPSPEVVLGYEWAMTATDAWRTSPDWKAPVRRLSGAVIRACR